MHVLIRIVDIPVFVEGNLVHLPAGSFEVAGGCSGIGFIPVGTSLATLYGYLYYSERRAQLLLIGIALLIAMIINWIRVFTVILIGNASHMQSPIVGDHATLGWIMFAIAMVPLFYFAHRLHPEPAPQSAPATQAESTSAANKSVWLGTAAVVITLAAAPLWAHSIRATQGFAATGAARPADRDGEFQRACRSDSRMATAVRLVHPPNGKALTVRRMARSGSMQMSTRRRHRIANSSISRNTPVGNLRKTGQRVRSVDCRRLDGRFGRRGRGGTAAGTQWIIWYWYDFDGRHATGRVEAKLLQALSFVLGNHTSGAIALAAACADDCTDARNRLQEFVSAANSGLQLSTMVSTEQPQ